MSSRDFPITGRALHDAASLIPGYAFNAKKLIEAIFLAVQKKVNEFDVPVPWMRLLVRRAVSDSNPG
jgi:hypothetical protein